MVKVEYEFECASCGEVETIQVEVSEQDAAELDAGTKTLKECCKPGIFEKEVFISGMCYACQEKVFNRPAPEHEKEWGKCTRECSVCGSPIWEKDEKIGVCPSCNTQISDMDEEEEYTELSECRRVLTISKSCSDECRSATETLLTLLTGSGRLYIEEKVKGDEQDIYRIVTDEEVSEMLATYSNSGYYSYEESGEDSNVLELCGE